MHKKLMLPMLDFRRKNSTERKFGIQRGDLVKPDGWAMAQAAGVAVSAEIATATRASSVYYTLPSQA
jgi:hypothetical protein